MSDSSVNKLFKIESKIMIGFPILIVLIGLLMAVFLPMFSKPTVDSCLDAGGSFDYQNCKCDFKETHEYKNEHSC